MQVRVLFFATLRDRAQIKEMDFEISEGDTVAEFKQRLVKQIPALSAYIGSMLVAVNRNYAFDEEIIPEKAEIALFPPVSGG